MPDDHTAFPSPQEDAQNDLRQGLGWLPLRVRLVLKAVARGWFSATTRCARLLCYTVSSAVPNARDDEIRDHDPKFMTPTAVPERAAAQRDVRLDFFRGLALFMILYDHVFLGARTRIPFFVQFTPYFWGLGCAAAIFIFISGQAYGVAYGRKLDQLGWRAVVARTVLRVGQLYVAQLAILALVWSGLHLEILSGLPHTSLTVFDAPGLFHRPGLLRRICHAIKAGVLGVADRPVCVRHGNPGSARFLLWGVLHLGRLSDH